MKELKCHKCSEFLGHMEKGKVKKGAVVICLKCLETYETFEKLAHSKHKGVDNCSKDMPDFLRKIFNKDPYTE